MSGRKVCGWYDNVSTLLQDMFSQRELADLPGALSLAAHIKGRYSFSEYTVYVNVTQGKLNVAELAYLRGGVRQHPILGDYVEEVYVTPGGKGLLFVAQPATTTGHRFVELVTEAFAELGFDTHFTANGGYSDFAKMR